MKRVEINEGSSGDLTASFYNSAGQPDVPTTVTVQIQCLTNNQEIRAEQAVSPASSILIPITRTENRIINQANQIERRRVTVRTTYGAEDGLNDQYDYVVRNLSQVT